MPALNFKAQFADQVRSGEKRQTIRARGKRNPPKPGDHLMLYGEIGSHKLLDVKCSSVKPISINTKTRTVRLPLRFGVSSVWTELGQSEIDELAKADGFASTDDFFAWFAEHYGDTFSGWLIKW